MAPSRASKRSAASPAASGKARPGRAAAATRKTPKAKKEAPRRTAVTTAAASRKTTRKTIRKKTAKQASDKNSLLAVVHRALDDMKAVNVTELDVRELTDITDTMIIASGTSDRHVRSLADRIIEYAKQAGYRPAGVEGERDGEWVLVDLQDVIVHVMLPRIREFYRLENLWDVNAARRAAAAAEG